MTFAPGPSIQSRRCACAAVLLPGERRVLAVGGRASPTHLATTEILDIGMMAFSGARTFDVLRALKLWGIKVLLAEVTLRELAHVVKAS